ncbi:MAG: hypothetical protein GEU71_04670 [Actinobacteria bacterium]|nr:hypothetical protein [Actinomycetota bacterium]
MTRSPGRTPTSFYEVGSELERLRTELFQSRGPRRPAPHRHDHLYYLKEEVDGSLAGLIPAGLIAPTAADSVPTGWLFCDGDEVSRETYASLFAAIGTTYGVGDGSTTFALPDLGGRFPLGKADSGTGDTLGETGGALDHTHTGPSHTHTGPSHTHSVSVSGTTSSEGSHTHSIGGPSATVARNFPTSGNINQTPTDSHTHSIGSGGSHSHSVSASGTTGADGTGATGASGTGATGTANPPYLSLNYIIKT